MWRDVPGHASEPGDEREAEAIRRWEQRGGRREWDAAGKPFARSRWEQDRGLWR
jgi:hypothetical protein